MFYKKNKFLINLLIIIFALIMMVIFIIYPAIKEIIRINREITRERIELEQKINQGFNLKKIQADLTEIEGRVSELNRIFISEGKELTFVTQLEDIAASDSVNLTLNPDFSKQEPESGTEIKKFPLQMEVKGNYNQIVKFIRDLEKLPYYYNIEMIVFSARENKPDQPLAVQLAGQAFIKKIPNN